MLPLALLSVFAWIHHLHFTKLERGLPSSAHQEFQLAELYATPLSFRDEQLVSKLLVGINENNPEELDQIISSMDDAAELALVRDVKKYARRVL